MTQDQVTEKKQSQAGASIIGVLAFIGLAWYFFGGGLDQQVANDMQQIHDQVAVDSVEQYGIARRSGTAMDRCVQAGLVTASYLQAKDEANYAKWKSIENIDCTSAGVPR